MSELGALYRELIAIGTQILKALTPERSCKKSPRRSSDIRASSGVGVSLYARPVPPDQPDPPPIAEYITVGLSPEEDCSCGSAAPQP
jgi:hypothetical protein